jgi:hypothetical protein
MTPHDPNASQKSQKFTGFRLRLKKGVSSASEGDLEGAVASLERTEIRFAAMVIFGVLLELVIAVIHPPYDSKFGIFGPVLGDFLVGLGIIGEVMCSSRVTICQGELTQRSNKKLAEADARAAEAIERAATLEKEAAEARSKTAEIERLVSWRSIPLWQRLEAASALSGKIKPDVFIEYEGENPESIMYSKDVEDLFKRAGSVRVRRNPTHMSVDGEPLFGLFICSYPDLVGIVIKDAFTSVGIPIIIENDLKISSLFSDASVVLERVYVYAGYKPPISG